MKQRAKIYSDKIFTLNGWMISMDDIEHIFYNNVGYIKTPEQSIYALRIIPPYEFKWKQKIEMPFSRNYSHKHCIHKFRIQYKIFWCFVGIASENFQQRKCNNEIGKTRRAKKKKYTCIILSTQILSSSHMFVQYLHESVCGEHFSWHLFWNSLNAVLKCSKGSTTLFPSHLDIFFFSELNMFREKLAWRINV